MYGYRVKVGVVRLLLLLLFLPVSVQAQTLAPVPTGLTVSGTTTTTISLTWTAPADDGNGAILGYNVYSCEEGETACTPVWLAWVDGGATTSYTHSSLTTGQEYRYAVGSSRGVDTESAWSNQVTATAEDPPQIAPAPTGLTVSGTTATSISLTWTAPADDGNGAILGYNVYSCVEGGVVCTPVWLAWVDGGTTTSYTHSSLTTGQEYRYAVGSSRGVDTESAWSNQVTATAEDPPQIAPAPTGLTVSGTTATSISLTWTAPADDGNGAILGYNVYSCVEGGVVCTPVWLAWVDGGTTTLYTHSSLTTGQEYRYAVGSSRGADTESAWSSQVTATAEDPPQIAPAPTGLSVQENPGNNVLRWTAPADDGNGAIIGYNVYRCVEGRMPCEPLWIEWVDGGTTTTYTDNDVTAGTTYRYAVGSSRGADTESAWSNQVTTTAAPPPPPVVLKVTGLKATAASADSISLSWKPSVKDVMTTYSVYRCTMPEGESTCDPYDGLWLANLENTNAYTDTEVTPGETYRYAVAVEPYRREELSRAITVVAQMPQMLSAPTGLMVTEVDESSVRLRWTAPEDDGRGPVESIDIYRCNVDRSPDCSEFLYLTSRNPALTEYKDNDVESETTYRYAVAAYRSDDEVSPWSNQVTATTQSLAPAAPTGLTVTSTSATAISLSWTAPSGTVDAFNVFRCVEGEESCVPEWYVWLEGGAITTFTDTDLSAETTYRYAVEAIRYNRSTSPWTEFKSAWSDQVTALADAGTTPPAEAVQAPAPTGLTVMSTSATAISLSWTAPADDGNGALYGYNVFRCEEGETACEPQWIAWVDGGTNTGYTDDGSADPDGTPVGLAAGTTYRYAVGASRGQGTESAWSDQVTALADAGTEPPAEAVQAPAPTGLTVMSTSATAISLSWTAPADDGHGALYGYNVFRCEEGETACEPQWIAWVDGGANTGYTDDGSADPDGTPVGLAAGTTYRYAVGASRGQGTESAWSDQVTALADAGTEPPAEAVQAPAPTGLTVMSTSATAISLSWTAPADDGHGALYGYNVLRCEEGETACEPQWIAWVDGGTNTGYTDDGSADPDGTPVGLAAGTTYRYAVGASRGQGTESAWSDQVTATADAGTEPPAEAVQAPAPTGLTVMSTSATAISLSWTAPADDGHGALYGYNVFRCEEGETACEPQWIAWVDGGTNTGYTDDGSADPDGTPVGLAAGTTYRYAVGASRGQGTESAWSDQVTALADAGTEPPAEAVQAPAPTGLTVMSTSATAISLSWTAPADDGNGALYGYNVFRCEEGETACEPQWIAWVDGGANTGYTDDGSADPDGTPVGLAAGTTYRYAVGASRGQGTESAWSDQVTALADAGTEPPAEAVQAPAPTGLTVMSTSATAISLSWTAPADDGNGAIIGYNVYRCDTGPSCTPEWKVWVDGGTTTTYTDSDVTTGITYRYAVGASRGQGTESAWSNQVTATASATDVGGPSPEERVLTLESGMAALGRTMAGQAVDTFGGRFASLSTSAGTQAPASRRLDSFSGALKLAAEQMGIPMAVADVDDVLHAGPEWGPWMSDADLLTEACSSTVSGCPEDTEGNLMLGNLTLRQLLSQNSFQLALGESDDSGTPVWTLWGRGSVSGFEGQSANDLALDGEVVSGYLGLDYRWGTDTLLGVAVSHSQGDIDYEETETGAGELETTMRSVYPYAYWSPRPGLGLWGVLGYGFGETAITDAAVSNLETDVEMWMAALGGRSELFTLGQVDMAVKADVFSVWTESDTLEALESTRVDSGRVRLALEGRTSLALSDHSRLTPSLELGTRWDTGDAETGLGAELGGALAYTNTRLGLSVEASGRYLLTHEEETFEEWGASLAACVSSGGDGTGLALSLKPVWGNAASGVDSLWGTDGVARVGATALTTPRSASWQPDRLDLGLRYGSDTSHGLLSPFGEVGLQGSDTYSMRLGTQLDTASGWKLDVFGGHVSRQAETADNLVGLTASYGFGLSAMNQAFAGTMLATSNWSTCDRGPAQKMASRTEPVTRRQEASVMQPVEETDNSRNPAAGDNRPATAVTREVMADSAEHTRIDKQSARAYQVIVPQQTEETDNWFIPVTDASRTAMVVAQQTDEASVTPSQTGAERRTEEVTEEAVSGSIEEITVKGIRRALKDALDVKRSSDHIVEALSLEDIDAIPNVTIAEALVRLPGVNGTRDRGNQSQATIRGLGPRMVLGTVNGREVASAEPSRNIRWEQYPSELISQVQVYKTQSADLIAGGIAGTINLETVAPLDYNGPKYTFNGVGAYYEGGKDIPNYSELGNKLSGSLVKAFNKKFGIALGVASQKQKNAFPSYQGWGFNSPGSWQPDFPADGGDLDGQGTTGYVPWGTQIEVGKMDTNRIGLLGAMQFRPSDAIDIRYDALYSEFDMNIEQDQTWYQGTGNTNNLQAGFYSDVEVVDGLALAATAQSPVPGCIHSPDGSEPPSIPQCFDIRHVLSLYDQENSVFTQGLNLEFSGDTIHVNADIAYSKAERKNYWHGLYFDDRNATFSYDFRGKPSVSVPEGSPSARPETAQLVVVDCNTGFCGSLNSNENQGSNLEDESWSYQLNINKSLDAGHLSSVDLGIRYSDRNKEVVWEQFKMSRGGDNPAQVLPDGFISYTLSALDTSPLLTAPSFKTAVNMFGGLDFSLAEIDEERYWRVSEENLAGYVKANFEGSIGSSSYYTANVGVRVVDVGTDSFDIRGAAIGNNYTEVLPSASLNLFLDEEKIIRLSASRAISRPPLDELRVGKLINAPAGSIEGNTGNPLLTPFISKQLDLSYEWYFAPESLAAATVYYKKIDDYIGYTYLDFEIKDGRIFYIYGPKNEQEGNIRGVELTFQAPYTSLLPKALKGVSAGIYSNYAYADSNIKELYPVDSPYSLAGLARHTATVDLWFWWRKFDLRFGWKYHSAFTTGFGWDGSELSTLDAETNISASLAYIVNDNITLRVQGYNLTDEPARSTRNNNGYNLRRFDKYGRAYFFGVSWKMW